MSQKMPQKSIDQDKLAAALRENLKKRKQQQRARENTHLTTQLKNQDQALEEKPASH